MPSTTPSGTASTTSTTPHRKAPQCSKCKRLRKGHPRSGCPFVNSPSNEKGQERKAMEGLTISSESVISGSDGSAEKTTIIKNRRRSTQPEQVVSPAAASRTAVWQETIRATPVVPEKATRSKIPLRSPMPRASIPPTSDSFIPSNTSTAKADVISANLLEQNSASSGLSSFVSSSTRRAQPLSRTMGAVERDMFITKLSYEAAATIYIVARTDVEAIVAQATTLKFTTHTIMNDNENDPQVLLILAREEAALQALLHKVENGNDMAQLNKKRTPRNGHRGSSTFKTAAGAAVVGFVDLLRLKKIYARPIWS